MDPASGSALRLLVVSNLYPPDVLGGYEIVARDVVDALAARGHEVRVLTTGARRAGEPPTLHRDLSLVRPFHEPASLDRIRHVVVRSAQERAVSAILDRHGPFDAALVLSLRRLGLHVPRILARRGVPTVYCMNDDWLLAHRTGEGATPLRRALWRAAERGPFAARTWKGVAFRRVVYVSAALRDALRSGGAPLPEGVVCFQGVDPRRFVARPLRPVPPAPRLLFAGRVHPTKGCDVAIEALARLREHAPEARLTVAGTGDRYELDRLRALALSLSVASAVRWLGFVAPDRIAEVYRDHDVFLFPSLWEEPAGLTYLEAMASGVPVVALARGGARELLVDGENALVCASAEDMARAVLRLIDAPALAAQIVAGGLSTLEARASLPAYVTTIERELRLAHSEAVTGAQSASRR